MRGIDEIKRMFAKKSNNFFRAEALDRQTPILNTGEVSLFHIKYALKDCLYRDIQ